MQSSTLYLTITRWLIITTVLSSSLALAQDPKCVGHASTWSYCVGNTTDQSGNKYSGSWLKGMLGGVGGVEFAKGGQYIGQWSNGELNGLGFFVSPDKRSAYIGKWESNQKSGLGIYFSKDSAFVGDFEGGKENGLGIHFLAKSGARKLAHFVEGKANGLSITLEQDGHGIWTNEVDGEANGIVLESENFSLKRGYYARGGDIVPLLVSDLRQRICGEVVHVQSNMCIGSLFGDGGSKYLGQTDATGAVPHGWGTYLFAEGAEYVGQYQRGLREGFGAIHMRSRDAFFGDYVGYFSKGAPAFYGAFLFANGTRYVGEIKDRKPHGYGIEVTDSEVYIGNFYTGKRDGAGAAFSRSMSQLIFEGEWDYGTALVKGKQRRRPRDELSTIELVERKFADEVMINRYARWCADTEEPRSGWTRCRVLLERYPEGFYNGDVLDGKFDGIGSLQPVQSASYGGTDYSGGKYSGEFSAGLFHGKGQLVALTGNTIFGTWERGRLVGEYLEVNGKTKQVRHLLAE